ncbi:UNVERIFIED_CONTAM: hypothetical protein K2H54_036122 [Gekko kuhli]
MSSSAAWGYLFAAAARPSTYSLATILRLSASSSSGTVAQLRALSGAGARSSVTPAWARAYPHATAVWPCTSSLAAVVRVSTSVSASGGSRLCISCTGGGWLSTSSAGGGWASGSEPAAGPVAHPPVAGQVSPLLLLPGRVPPLLPGPALLCLQPRPAQHGGRCSHQLAQHLRQPQPRPPMNVKERLNGFDDH